MFVADRTTKSCCHCETCLQLCVNKRQAETNDIIFCRCHTGGFSSRWCEGVQLWSCSPEGRFIDLCSTGADETKSCSCGVCLTCFNLLTCFYSSTSAESNVCWTLWVCWVGAVQKSSALISLLQWEWFPPAASLQLSETLPSGCLHTCLLWMWVQLNAWKVKIHKVQQACSFSSLKTGRIVYSASSCSTAIVQCLTDCYWRFAGFTTCPLLQQFSFCLKNLSSPLLLRLHF